MSAQGDLGSEFVEHRLSHRPAGPDDGAPLHQADEVMPDVTGAQGPQFYDFHSHEVDESGQPRPVPFDRSISAESFRQMRAAKDNPDYEATIYRAVPRMEHGIQSGDWVTTSRRYAAMHADAQGDGSWVVVSERAKASELWSDGNDPNEWGYHPSR